MLQQRPGVLAYLLWRRPTKRWQGHYYLHDGDNGGLHWMQQWCTGNTEPQQYVSNHRNRHIQLVIKLLNTLGPRQDGRYFADDIFKCIYFNENGCILIKFSLKYVRKGSIDNNPPLVQIMAWRRSGDKPLSEPMMIILLTHICVTRPQWVKLCLRQIECIMFVCVLHASGTSLDISYGFYDI